MQNSRVHAVFTSVIALNIVYLVAYINMTYMLSSNEKITKIEKTYLPKHRQVSLSLMDKPVFAKRPRPSG